ncbi:MAG: hypothetical protein WCB79_07060 [Halobacteriota archaeon]
MQTYDTAGRRWERGQRAKQVPVVIPTLNEEPSIGKVIDGVPVADLLQNGLKMAAIRVAGDDVLRYIKRSV